MPATLHFAVLASPLAGHLNPLQALGAELTEYGHRVTVVHVGDASRFMHDDAVGFAPLLPRTGVEPLSSYLATLARPTGPNGFRRMIRATAGMTAALLDGAPEVLERIGADAVIADAVEPAGPLVAARLGLPHAVAVTGLPLMREPGVPPPFVNWRYRTGALARLRNRGGYAVSDLLMRPIVRILADRRRGWGLTADDPPRQCVAQCPNGLDYPRADLPARFLYTGPWRRKSQVEVDLPQDGRPLIFCSLGTLQGARRTLFATMAEACATAGGQAVIGHGGGLSAAEEASLPGRPLVRAFWPQEAVLRHCTAAILHGGFNSVLDALAASVPTVALPIAFEQPATAARLVRIGAGLSLSPNGLCPDALARALREVMERFSYRAAAGRIAREIAEAGGAAHAAAAISAAFGETS